MLFADLAINPRAEAELRWFYLWADGEMGLRSNFMAMVAQLESGSAGGGAVADFEERMFDRLEAAGDARRIRRALEGLTNAQRWILRKVFGPGARRAPGLGSAAPLAPFTAAAILAHRASGTSNSLEEWIYRLGYRCSQPRAVSASPRKTRRAAERATTADQMTLEAIRQESEAVLSSALTAFAASLRRRGR